MPSPGHTPEGPSPDHWTQPRGGHSQESPWWNIDGDDLFGVGLPGGLDSKGSACNAGDLGLIPGFGRSPREGNGYPLLGESHGQSSLAGYSPWYCKELDTTE